MLRELDLKRRLSVVVALAVAGLATMGAASALAASDVNYSANSSGSDIDIDGENDVDLITVSLAGNTVTITDTGPGGITTADPDCTAVNASTVTCPFDPPDPAPPAEPFQPVDNVQVELEEDDDTFTTSAPIDTNVDGDDGNDNLQTGSADDFLDGEAGNDTLNGGEGDDDLDDGHTAFGTGGNDVLIGGPGRDAMTGNRRELPTTVTLDGVANDGFPSLAEADNVQVEEFEGGNGDDTLVGDDDTNGISAFLGNDVIQAGGGTDTMGGGPGDDQIDPGAGVDDIHCGSGIDTALLTPGDFVSIGDFGTVGLCERTGAEIVGESVTMKGKNGKVRVSCAAHEAAQCTGKVVLLSNGKKLSKKGKFKVGAGKTKSVKVKLSKKGAKKLKKAGNNLLVTAEAQTTYPFGKSLKEARVMLIGKSGGK
jgi:hypothetical protein